MQTILEVLKKTTDFFEKKGIENARLDAELLMSHALNCKRLDLYLRFEEPLTEDILNKLREWVKRRGSREPLQYIIEEVAFMDLRLKVGSGVLIPRSETEELVQKLLDRWGSEKPKTILDLGTGSGAIALALAKGCSDTKITAVDASKVALDLAKENAKLCNLESQVTFIESDWLTNVNSSFDWIVSNPPYLTEEEWSSAQPEVKDYEAKTALVSGDEGLQDICKILGEAKEYLNPGGGITFETGIAHHERLCEVCDSLGYQLFQSEKDLSGYNRFFTANA